MSFVQSPIAEARAFLDIFLGSGWTSCHVRGGAIELFVSRDGGHANPMIAAAVAPVEAGEGMTLAAPHVGTLVGLAAIGSRIVAGERYGAIELLGEEIALVADREGLVARHIGRTGALVEYGEPLILLN